MFRPIDFGTVQNACKFQLKPTSMEKGLVHVHTETKHADFQSGDEM